LYFPFRRH